MNRFNLTPGRLDGSTMGPPGPAGGGGGGGGGLTRYGSAPGSLLATLADSVLIPQAHRTLVGSTEPIMSRFFPGDSSDSSCRTGSSSNPHAATAVANTGPYNPAAYTGIHVPPPSIPDIMHKHAAPVPPPSTALLQRHSSSPAGLLSHLVDPQGHSGTKGMGNYSHGGTETIDLLTNSRLRPQWSFSRQDSLSQLSDISIPDMGEGVTNSWADTGTLFNNHLGKRSRDDSDDFMASLGNMDEMEYMQMNQDVATCKLRAKRGCATHPRSIAERERRTRISKRLRKLQELVPNMDKQTSTSDMLDLAVQYIKDLQGQLQKIREEQQNCTCSSKVL